MSTSLSNLVDNLSEIYNEECRGCKERKIESVCDFIGVENNKLPNKCNECEKRQIKPINGLIKKFSNTYEFCNGDINKFAFLLRKGFYPYEYMDSWERFAEGKLPDEKAFYSELCIEDITHKDYTHAQKVCKEFKIKPR